MPKNEAALLQQLAEQGLKAYRRSVALRASPVALKQETRPILDDMARVSQRAASQLKLDDALIASAVRVAYNLLQAKEQHTELTSGVHHEEDVAIITDRGALLREAEACLRRIPEVEDQDVRIIVGTLADKLRHHVAAHVRETDEACPRTSSWRGWRATRRAGLSSDRPNCSPNSCRRQPPSSRQ